MNNSLLQCFVDFRQQPATLAVGQEAVVTHHSKMPRRDVAEVMPQHLFLAQLLAFVLLSFMVIILVNNRSATVMALMVALTLISVEDIAEVGQLIGINAIVAGTQQMDNGTTPDGFNLLFFAEQVAPNV